MLPQSCCPLLSSKSEVTGGMGAHSHHSGCISGHSSDCPVQNLPYTRCPQRHIGLKYPQWLCVQGGKAVSDQGPQGAEVCSWHMPGVLAVALAEGANMAPLGLWFPGPGRVSLQPCVHRARQQSRHQPLFAMCLFQARPDRPTACAQQPLGVHMGVKAHLIYLDISLFPFQPLQGGSKCVGLLSEKMFPLRQTLTSANLCPPSMEQRL